MAKGLPAARKVFRLPLPYRLLMSILTSLAFFFPAAIVIFSLTHNEIGWLILLLSVHAVLFLLSFRFWSIYFLAVSPAGVEYRSPVHRIRTTWENIEAIAQVGGWTKPVQGLRLRQPVGRYPILALLIALPRRDLARSIPVEIFALRRWQESQVGQEIRRHAPGLFASETA
jgi:hypothetical protein